MSTTSHLGIINMIISSCPLLMQTHPCFKLLHNQASSFFRIPLTYHFLQNSLHAGSSVRILPFLIQFNTNPSRTTSVKNASISNVDGNETSQLRGDTTLITIFNADNIVSTSSSSSAIQPIPGESSISCRRIPRRTSKINQKQARSGSVQWGADD
jgi:hypothetical protein